MYADGGLVIVPLEFSSCAVQAELCEGAFEVEKDSLRFNLVADEGGRNFFNEDGDEFAVGIERFFRNDFPVGGHKIVVVRGEIAFQSVAFPFFIFAHEFSVGEDVPFHSRFHLFFGGGGKELEQSVEGVELEKVAVLAIRRTRANVLGFSSGIHPLDAERFGVFRDRFCGGRNVEYNPVVVHSVRAKSAGNVGVVHDQDERFGGCGHALKLEGRVDILSFASVERGDNCLFFEGGTGEFHAKTVVLNSIAQ